MITLDRSFSSVSSNNITIKILGIGGAGGNAVENLLDEKFNGVECCVLNTDIQALSKNKVENKIQLGCKSIGGIGTGANPEIGKMAAEEDIELILSLVDDADIVFLVGGLGGGTGSGAIPIIAKILQERQILSIALVTKPFLFEGSRRMNTAQEALEKLEHLVDTLIIIPNQKLFEADKENYTPLIEAFGMVNRVICNCIKTVIDTIQNTGNINVDFADIKTTLTRMGKAVMSIGKASGESRAENAINSAVSSPLLEHTSLKGARSILLNISGDKTLSLHEMSIIAGYVHDQAHPEAHIIVGSVISEIPTEELSVTIIATGFDDPLKTRNINKQGPFYNSFNGYSQSQQAMPYLNKTYTRENKNIEDFSQKNYTGVNNYAKAAKPLSQNNNQSNNEENSNIEIPAIFRKLMHDQN